MPLFVSLLQTRRGSERFAKPALPTPTLGLNTSAPNVLTTINPLLATGSAAIYGNSSATGPAGSSSGTGVGNFLSNLSSERLSLGAVGGGVGGVGSAGGSTFLAGAFQHHLTGGQGGHGQSSSASSSSSNLMNLNMNNSSSGNMIINSSSSNSSLSAFTPTNPPSGAATAFIQPDSPMDTSTSKE